jgi:hypothetical protein
MVPRQAGLGRSFKGAGAYYLHDKDAATSERVAFTHTENIPTQDPDKALKWMAWTAIHADDLKRESGAHETGQPCSKPVFTFSLAWHPEQEPQKSEMLGAGRGALVALGLEEHETLMVAHRETDHPHLHLIVNTVHPETGKVNTLSYSKLKLSKWAEGYEREHGKIYCQQRVENNQQREQGKFTKHDVRIAQLYHSSDSGKAFQEALAEAGYKLAQGKRVVVIDDRGKVHSLSRQIKGVKAKDIRAKLGDLELPPVEDAQGESGDRKPSAANQTQKRESPDQSSKQRHDDAKVNVSAEYFDRDAQDRAWQESIIDAALAGSKSQEVKPKPKTKRRAPTPEELNALQDRHLAELGRHSDEKLRARLRLADELERQYGEHERQLRGEAERLENVLANSGRVRTWWLKVTRQIPKTAEQDLQNIRLSLADVERRRSEALGALETDMAHQRQAIEARHQEERAAIGYELAPRKVNNTAYAPRQITAEVPEGPEQGEDQGPSLNY